MAEFKITTDEAVKKVRELIEELKNLKKTGSSFGNSSKESFGKAEKGLEDLDKVAGKLSKSMKNLTSAQKKNTEAIKKSNTAKKQTTQTNKGLLSSTWSLVKAYGILQASMLFTKAIKSAFELTKTFDSLRFSMEKTVGTAEEVASANSFLITLAKNYGAELVTLTNRYVKFFVAAKQSGVALRDTQDIFETFTKVSGVMGLKADELNGVFLALEQMLSKGKITTEELRRQLGERLPGAMGIMAASMGVSIEQLDKMMKKGEVLSAEVLPNFAKAVETAYGIESVKKVNTLVAAQNRMTTAWQLFVKAVTKDSSFIQSVFNQIGKGMTSFTLIFGDQASKLSIYKEQLNNAAEELFNEGVFEKWGKAGIEFLNKQKETTDSLVDARTKLAELTLANFEGVNNDKILEQEKVIKDLTNERITQKNELIAAEIVFARTQKDTALESFQMNKKTFNDGEKSIEQFESLSWSSKKYNESVKSSAWKEYDKAIRNREKNTQNLAIAQLELNKIQKVLNKDIDNIKKPEPKTIDTEKDFRIRLAAAIKYSESVIKNDEDTIREQELLARANKASRIAIAKSLYKDQIKLAEGDKNKIKEAVATKNKLILEAETKLDSDLDKVAKNTEKRNQENLDKQLEAEDVKYINKQEAESRRWGLLTSAQQDEQDAIDEHNRILIEAELAHSKAVLKIKLASGQISEKQYAEALLNITKLEESLKKIGDYDGFTDWIEKNQEGLLLLADTMTALSDLSAAFSDRKLQQIEKEQEALEKAHERDLERLDEATERSLEAVAVSGLSEQEKADRATGINESKAAQEKRLSKAKEKRDEQLAKKEAKVKRRQAIIDKAAALAQITVNTAVAYTKTLATGGLIFGLPLAKVVLALGAIQAATVLASPIPAFAEGGENKKNQKILINDHKSGRQEYVNRGGKILTTTKKNAVIDGKKGDFIYKDYQTMMHDLGYGMMHDNAKQTLTGGANIFNPSSLIAMQDNSNLESSIKKGIKNGFGGINHTTIINVPKGATDYFNERGY